jgi:hypothetical protein
LSFENLAFCKSGRASVLIFDAALVVVVDGNLENFEGNLGIHIEASSCAMAVKRAIAIASSAFAIGG